MSSSTSCQELSNLNQIQTFKKSHHLSVICFCTIADPSSKHFLGALTQIKPILERENDNVGVALMDVDETTDDVVTPHKVRAIPTTVFVRDGRETARVEGADVDALRKAVATHLLSTTKTIDPTTATATATATTTAADRLQKMTTTKKSATAQDGESEGDEEQEDDDDDDEASRVSRDVKIVNCYFGNLDSGKFVDVTDKIRSVIEASFRKNRQGNRKIDNNNDGTKKIIGSLVITASREFLLGSSSASFTNSENNKLRIVVDKSGVGKTFTIPEGKSLDLGEALNFHYVEHAGGDALDHYRNTNDSDDGDFTGNVNPFGGIPSVKIPEGAC